MQSANHWAICGYQLVDSSATRFGGAGINLQNDVQ